MFLKYYLNLDLFESCIIVLVVLASAGPTPKQGAGLPLSQVENETASTLLPLQRTLSQSPRLSKEIKSGRELLRLFGNATRASHTVPRKGDPDLQSDQVIPELTDSKASPKKSKRELEGSTPKPGGGDMDGNLSEHMSERQSPERHNMSEPAERDYWIPKIRRAPRATLSGDIRTDLLRYSDLDMGSNLRRKPLLHRGGFISKIPSRPHLVLLSQYEESMQGSPRREGAYLRSGRVPISSFTYSKHKGYLSYLSHTLDHRAEIVSIKHGSVTVMNPDLTYLPFSLGSEQTLEPQDPPFTTFWYLSESNLTGQASYVLPKNVYSHLKTDVTATSLKCPQLSSFTPVSINDIGCSTLIKKYDSIATGTLKWMKPEKVQTVGDACVARQFYVKRGCWYGFFGNKEYAETTIHTQLTNITTAKRACAGMYDQVSSTYSYSSVPDYSCWWCKSTDVTGYYWRGDRISVKFHLPTRTIMGDQLGSVDCPLSATQGCVTKVGDRVFPQDAKMYISDPEFVSMSGECNYKEGANVTQVYAEGFGAGYIYNDCWYSPYGEGEHLYAGVDGSLWDIGPLAGKCTPKAKDECNTWKAGKTISTSVHDPVLDTTWQLHGAVRDCLARRQIIQNSLALQNPFDPALLESISYRGTSNFVLLPFKGSLYGAKCTPVSYDNLVFRGHDIWEVLMAGTTVGCMDARVGAIFPDCVAYNETQVMLIDNQWSVECGTSGCTATYQPGNPGDALRVVTEVNSAIGSYLDKILNPPAYGPSFGPGASEPDSPVRTDQSLGIEIWWNGLSLFGKIGSVFGIVVGFGLGALVLYFMVKCCCGAVGNRIGVPS